MDFVVVINKYKLFWKMFKFVKINHLLSIKNYSLLTMFTSKETIPHCKIALLHILLAYYSYSSFRLWCVIIDKNV